MSGKAQKVSWLRGVMDSAANTQRDAPYHFETGDTVKVKRTLTLDQHANICRRAFADVEIARAVLVDAQNHVVTCEGDLMKAELALDEAQKGYSEAASEIPGVPVK